MGRAKDMMMEFEEADRNELEELNERKLEDRISELKDELVDQQDLLNDIISSLVEDDIDEEVDLLQLDVIVKEIKSLASSMSNVSDEIARRDELKENLKYKG